MKRKQFPVRWPFDTNTLKECNGYLASIAFGNDPLSQIDHKQGERKKKPLVILDVLAEKSEEII